MRKFKLFSKMGVMMAASLTMVGMLNLTPMDVEAAAKVKSLKVTTSNKVLKSSKTIYVGGPKSLKTTTLKVSVSPAKASKKVKYQSLKKKVATVTSSGKVTAKKAGKATIVVTSKSNKKVTKKVTITVKKYVAPKMTAKTSQTTIYNGNGANKTAVVTAGISGVISSKKVTFTSSNPGLATVSANGVVTANSSTKAGNVTITVKSAAKTYDNKILSQTVQIKVANRPVATSVKLDASQRSLTKTGITAEPTTTLKATVSPATANQNVTWSSSDTTVVKVNANGVVTGLTTGEAVITAKTQNGKTATCSITVRKTTVPVHDPSIFDDPNSDKYYTIGTGVAMAVSSDLQAWTNTTSGVNLFKNGINELQPLFDYTGNKDMGSVWAADLIYNTSMKQYCMYTCAAATGFKTAIAMFSSDKVTGPYEYKGMIVCADFNSTTLDKTNIVSALGLSDTSQVPAMYYDASETGTSGSDYYKANFPDAIDPAPFYGHDGNLYLTYGSFTCYGGIRVLKLNPNTGLRDKNYNYDVVEGVSDPYFGKKITNKAGEGPYIQKVACSKSSTGYYYYLWTSSGLLRGSGNYTMSMWRSENPDGPYVDANGTDATVGGGNVMVYNYKYSFMKYAHTSMGGNSALVDEDGKIYLVYHNKFSDNSPNPGSHMVKVHQMFVNEDGWLVMAPFEYHGETIASSYKKEVVAGNYEFIMHRQSTTSYVGDYNYNISVPLRLNADGTVTGYLEGTWDLSGNHITITVGKTVYKGVVLEQYQDDGSNGYVSSLERTMVFTALGSDKVNITGTKVTMTDAEAVAYDVKNISIPAKTETDFTLPVMGVGGSDITWASDNTEAMKINGNTVTVVRLDGDTTVTLTATVKRGSKTETKQFNVFVPAYEIVLPTTITSDTTLALPDKSVQGNSITWTSSNEEVIQSSTGVVTIPASGLVEVTLTATYGDVQRTFKIRVGQLNLKSIFTQDYQTEGLTMANAGWATHAALSNEIAADAENMFAKLTSTGSGPRSGLQTFDIAAANLTSTYVVATDFAVTTASYSGSGQPTTQIAFVSQTSTATTNNAVLTSECIVDLRATGMSSDTFVINGNAEETVTIPAGTWCHIEATVNQTDKQVFVMITDADGEELYSGTFAISGDTQIKGIYTLNGRGGTITQFDNTAVKVVE